MIEQQSIGIICTSVHHNNTRKLAEAFADALCAPIYSVEEAKAIVVSNYDLLAIGSGIYFGRHHPSLLQFVESWPAHPCRAMIYSTAGLPFLSWFQHWALRKKLIRRGFKIVGEFCCRGWDSVGPLWLMGGINRKHPSAKDLERARAFALQLIHTIQKDR